MGVAGLGIVLCNATGKVIAALSQRVPLPSLVAMVEALAYRRVMEFAKEISALDCIIKGDVEVVLKAIWNEDFSYLEYGYVIDDILVLNRDFHFSSFCHVKRLGNIVAHYLAKRSKSGVKLRVWFDTTLDDIAPLVSHDAL